MKDEKSSTTGREKQTIDILHRIIEADIKTLEELFKYTKKFDEELRQEILTIGVMKLEGDGTKTQEEVAEDAIVGWDIFRLWCKGCVEVQGDEFHLTDKGAQAQEAIKNYKKEHEGVP